MEKQFRAIFPTINDSNYKDLLNAKFFDLDVLPY